MEKGWTARLFGDGVNSEKGLEAAGRFAPNKPGSFFGCRPNEGKLLWNYS